MKLNLGCGADYREGYVNADREPGNVDLIVDLDSPPYPFEDDSVNEVLLQHVLEHVIDVRSVLDELWRISPADGRLVALVPHFTHFQALTHPEHRHAFHYNSLAMFTPAAGEPYTDRLWTIEKAELHFGSRLLQSFFNRHQHTYTTTFLAYVFPAYEIEFHLRPLKP